MRQGKIDPNLREKTLDTFKLDSEKEDFLKEFKHWRELVAFYLARGRVKEAVKYSIKTGEFEEALEMIFDRAGTANMKEIDKEFQLSEVFKYAQTRKLLSSLSKNSASVVDINHEDRFSGFNWSDPWATLATVANGYFKDGIKPKRDNIQEDWIKEYLDTIVRSTIKPHLRSSIT